MKRIRNGYKKKKLNYKEKEKLKKIANIKNVLLNLIFNLKLIVETTLKII
jgi:hypothetical protein